MNPYESGAVIDMCAQYKAEVKRQEQKREGAEPSDTLTATAPERIWLQVNPAGSPTDRAEPFPSHAGGVTWCRDDVGGVEVEYVRADLASAAQPDPIGADTLPDYRDPRVKRVYDLLCECDLTGKPDGDHWEGWIARRIVAALASAAQPEREPHPPHRDCGCADCAPSFEPDEPTPTATMRYDLSSAAIEGAIRNRLIEMGWTPPDAPKVAPAAECGNCFEGKSDLDHVCLVCSGTGYVAAAPKAAPAPAAVAEPVPAAQGDAPVAHKETAMTEEDDKRLLAIDAARAQTKEPTMTTEQQGADVIREAFEKDFFADAPIDISARNRSGDGYEFSIADNAWKTWKRAWQAAHHGIAGHQPAAAGPDQNAGGAAAVDQRKR